MPGGQPVDIYRNFVDGDVDSGSVPEKNPRGPIRPTDYSRTTLTRNCAVTSWCSRIETRCSPSALIGSSSVMRLRSIGTPRVPREYGTACGVTPPQSVAL